MVVNVPTPFVTIFNCDLWNLHIQDPEKRFTYCSEFNSASVVPVDVEALEKQEQKDSVSAWQTADGFVYPGVDTAMKSNVHPKKPDPARIDELRDVS